MRRLALALLVVSAPLAASAGQRLPLSDAAHEFGGALPPMGWTDFCVRHAAECVKGQPGPVRLTEELWDKVVRVNLSVNRSIEQVTDQEHWGKTESWDLPDDGKGDCEDIALEKRKRLAASGIPIGALLMTVVRDEEGQGHAVLTLTTDRGDFVLDNKRDRIKSWAATGYDFIKRQSPDDPSRWVALRPEPAPPTVASKKD